MLAKNNSSSWLKQPVMASALGAAAFVGFSAHSADAALTLQLFTPGQSVVTYVDSTSSGYLSEVNLNYGQFQLSINTGSTNELSGGTHGVLQITGLTVHNSANVQSNLYISLSANGYNFPGSFGDTLSLDSSIGGTLTEASPTDSVTFQSYESSSNTLYGIDTDVLHGTTALSGFVGTSTPLQSFITPPSPPTAFSFSDDQTAPFSRPTLYSLTNLTTLTLSANSQANYSGTTAADAQQPSVPEPTTLSLLSLASVGLLARRRKA